MDNRKDKGSGISHYLSLYPQYVWISRYANVPMLVPAPIYTDVPHRVCICVYVLTVVCMVVLIDVFVLTDV